MQFAYSFQFCISVPLLQMQTYYYKVKHTVGIALNRTISYYILLNNYNMKHLK